MVLLGKKIKELRTKSKFTQSELANLLGVTKSSVASYENDSRQLSFSVLIKIAQIFNVSTDYLLLNKPEKNISIASLNEEQTEIIKSLIKTFTESNTREHNLKNSLLNETYVPIKFYTTKNRPNERFFNFIGHFKRKSYYIFTFQSRTLFSFL